MDRDTSTGYASEACLWFPEFEDFDDEVDDVLPLYDDDGENEDDEDGFRRPEVIDFRPSPVCQVSPRVRMLAERHRQDVSDILNLRREAIVDGRWLELPLWIDLPPGAPVIQRIFWANVLKDEQDLEAVRADLRGYREGLPPALDRMDGSEVRADFLALEHHLRDWKFLTPLLGCKRQLVDGEWWRGQLHQIERRPETLSFLRARDVMRRSDPRERELARLRDAKRRATKSRREYLSSAPVLASEAARKRASRATAAPEQKEREAARKRKARAARTNP